MTRRDHDQPPRGRVWCRTCGGSGEIWGGSRDPQFEINQTCWRCHGDGTITKSKAAELGWPINQPQGVTA